MNLKAQSLRACHVSVKVVVNCTDDIVPMHLFQIVRYQMYHAIGLIILGVIGINFPYGTIQIPGYLFSLGILLFSGSLYLLVITNIRWLGAVTPIGGLCFIAGWILLSLNIYKS